MTLQSTAPLDQQRTSLPTAPALLRRRGRWTDLVALALVPAVLLVVYALPTSIKEAMVLSYTAPTLLTALASHYVHFSPLHLAGNLAGYLALASLGYLLSVASGRRRSFFIAFVAFLLAVPFTLSLLNLLIPRPRVGYGFSGVTMAFLGFLPVALFWHLEANVDRGLDIAHSPVLFFAGLGVIAAWAVPLSVGSAACIITAIIAVALYLRTISRSVPVSLRSSLRVAASKPGHLELVVAGLALYAGLPFAAFAPGPVDPSTVVNLYTHLLGYSLGYIASFLTFGLLDPGIT